ncbi:hypothetical protein FOZ61_011061 [Perkinsus olseni]|uniref:subtilisin n=1 Tax=Perkinsus olseni TaxID=32597 RepID=A0A7J6KZJ7_PEROL|nr:hypothetical protein FOZ61_011061 [Perkinsus olseni]KAF4651856.1 hypothetical protein FOL46_010016 [Perkinsus olseni]
MTTPLLTTLALLLAVASSNSDCRHGNFDADGVEWEGPETCAEPRRRFLQTTDYIRVAPDSIQVEIHLNESHATDYEFNLLVTNTGPSVEVVDFTDLTRDLDIIEHQPTAPNMSPLVDRPSRVAGTEGFTRGRDGEEDFKSTRAIIDIAGRDPADVLRLLEQLSAPLKRAMILHKLELGVLQAAADANMSSVIEEVASLGLVVEADLPLTLTGQSVKWIELTESITEQSHHGQENDLRRPAPQWSLVDLGVDGISKGIGSWRVDEGSKVAVAVLDSGVDFEHPSLEGSIAINVAEREGRTGVDSDNNDFVDDVRGWNFVADNGNVMDNIGHGTHCAGLIAANGNDGLIGTGSSYARVLPLKIFDVGGDGYGKLSDALRAIDYAVSRGVKISSISWVVGGYSEAFRLAVERAKNYHHIFVASAGNSGMNLDETGGSYPCGFAASNVLCVGAHGPDRSLIPASNFGRGNANSHGDPCTFEVISVVDVSAPGAYVISTTIDGGSDVMAGTSVAAAQIAGVVAMLVGARRPFPLHFDDIVVAITTTAVAPSGTAFGHVDASRSLEVVTGRRTLRKTIYVSAGHPRKAISRIRMRPHQSKAVSVIVSSLQTSIGYREYDVRGSIGGSLVDISIKVRATGGSFSGDETAKCELSNNGTLDFGQVVVGQESGVVFDIRNAGDMEVSVVPDNLADWSPLLTVMEPTTAVALRSGDSMRVKISLVAREVEWLRFPIDSLIGGCDPMQVVAHVVPNPLVVYGGPTTVSLPAGQRSSVVMVNVSNPSNYTTHRASLRPRERYYLFEAVAAESVSFPLTSIGEGWKEDMDLNGTGIDCSTQQQPTVVQLGRGVVYDGDEVDRVSILCGGLVMIPPFNRPLHVNSSSRFIAAYWVSPDHALCDGERGCRVSYLVTVEGLVVEWRYLYSVETAANVTVQLQLRYDGRVALLYPAQRPYLPEAAVVGLGHANFASWINNTGPMALLWTPRVSSTAVDVPPGEVVTVDATLHWPPFGANGWAYDGSCGHGLDCANQSSSEFVWSDHINIISGASAAYYHQVSAYGTELLYADVLDDNGTLSSDGGHTLIEVLALDGRGYVNSAEDGLLVTVSMLVGVEPFDTVDVLLKAGLARASFEVPAGKAPVSVTAKSTREVEIPFGVVNCGGNFVAGDNDLRYLLWNPSDGRLMCAVLNGSALSAVGMGGALGGGMWISVMMANHRGQVMVPSDRIPRRSGMVILGQESDSLGSGHCEGFCVFGGLLDLNVWRYLREAVEKVIRELPITTTTEDPRDKKPTPEAPTRTAITLTGVTTTTTTTTTWWNTSTTVGTNAAPWTTTELLVTMPTTTPITTVGVTTTTAVWSAVEAPTTMDVTTTTDGVHPTTAETTTASVTSSAVHSTTTGYTGNGTRRLRESGYEEEEGRLAKVSPEGMGLNGGPQLWFAVAVIITIFMGFGVLCVRAMRRRALSDKEQPLEYEKSEE